MTSPLLPEPVRRATERAEQAAFADDHHERKTAEVRARLLGHRDLASVDIGWSTGLILSTRRRA